MKLDVFEGFSNAKWLGLFHSDKSKPPKSGEILYLKRIGTVCVRSCIPLRGRDNYQIIVERCERT